MAEFTKSQIEQISGRLSDDDYRDILFLQNQRKALTETKYVESLDPDNLYDRRRAAAFNQRLLDSAFENPQRLALLPPPIDPTQLREERAVFELQIPHLKGAIGKESESIRPNPDRDMPVDVVAKTKLHELSGQVQDIAERTGTAKEDLVLRLLESHYTELQKSWKKDLLDGNTSPQLVDSYYSNRIHRVNGFAYELRKAFPHLAGEIDTLDPPETRRQVERQVRQLQEQRQSASVNTSSNQPSKHNRIRQSGGYGY